MSLIIFAFLNFLCFSGALTVSFQNGWKIKKCRA